MPNETETQKEVKEKIVYKTPPKISFIMGVLSGVTLASLVALTMMYSVLKSDVSEDTLGTSNTNAKVAGVETTPSPSPTPTPSAEPTPTKVDIELRSDDHIRGAKNAAVTMVEYSDFQCPFCARAMPTIDKILEDYEGKVNLVYRHFPLSFHQNAQKAAEASECAADQEKFWEFHDLMFENQSSLDVASLKGFAKDLGLNTSTFDNCLDSGKYEQKVKDDFTEGSRIGVSGTPATFINGKMISGAQPYEVFKAAVDSALADK